MYKSWKSENRIVNLKPLKHLLVICFSVNEIDVTETDSMQVVTSSFNQGYYKMLMDTLKGEQINEAPIKSNRVLFTSFRFCTKCMCNCIEHVHYRQMASRTLWERNSLEAPQHIACACKYHAAPEQDIYYTKSDILYVYILRGLTTYCSCLHTIQ